MKIYFILFYALLGTTSAFAATEFFLNQQSGEQSNISYSQSCREAKKAVENVVKAECERLDAIVIDTKFTIKLGQDTSCTVFEKATCKADF